MIKYIQSFFILFFLLDQFHSIAGLPERPKLVVGIVVDQMRHDYLYRYYTKYGEGGFKRMLREGFSCENTHYNYAPTVTAPGHASIYTGTTPAFHGIIGNEWRIRYNRKPMYCVDDTTVISVGGMTSLGKMSPVNLLATTITDELRLYTYDRSKVIGISMKDRGAILPAGHHPNAAYWFDANSGSFMTSSYYMKDLPPWLKDFNAENNCLRLLQKGWNTLKPIETYTESYKDSNPYEGTLPNDKAGAVFPHNFNTTNAINYGNVLNTPAGNTLLNDLAKRIIDKEKMGDDDITDFLTVSFSTPDYAGHLFGLQSIEVEDIYLRLDLEFENLFQYLDQKVGKGKYLVFLTADHGVAQVPQFLKDNGYPGDYFEGKKMMDTLNAILDNKFGKFVIDGVSGNQIFLNEDRISFKNYNRIEIISTIKSFVSSWPGVAGVYDRSEVPLFSTNNPVLRKLQLGFNNQRSGDIIFYLLPGWFEGVRGVGTTHGTPYSYDSHVPLVWFGWNIKPGASFIQYDITDIAPTISHLLQIPIPSGSFGKPVLEILK